MPIPKILHIIWIGDESKRPDKCIETWKRLNPSFEVRVWGNRDLAESNWQLGELIRKWFPREINGAADVMRWEILFKYGGVAVDADSICVRPLEDWLLEPDVFATWENETARPGLIACGALGAVSGHPFIRLILQDLLDDPHPSEGMAWQKVGPGRITQTYRYHKYSDLTIYPSYYFIPEHFSGISYHGSGPIFARQIWASTRFAYGSPEIENLGTIRIAPNSNGYTRAHEAAVALSENKPQLAKRLAEEALKAEKNQHVAQMVLRALEEKKIESQSSALIERSVGESFFLQKIRLAPSIANRLDLFLPYVRGRRVLHVGCVDSPIFDPSHNLHLWLGPQCATLHGLDSDRVGLKTLASFWRGVYFASVKECLAAGNRYDIILVPETIEHVVDAKQFLADLDSLPFQQAIITAPSVSGWGRLGVFSKREGQQSLGPYGWILNTGSFVEEIHPDHKYWFSPYTLANLVSQSVPWQIEKICLLQADTQIALVCRKRG